MEGIAKRYVDAQVLQDVSVDFPAGVTSAIVGASGSGKTTLLRLVNGLLRQDAGSLEVFGEAIPHENVKHYQRRLGYAVQGAGLFPHLTVRRNIGLVAQLERWDESRIEARIAGLLDDMGLPEEILTRQPRQLSGGQQQRVGLCRALMLEPELLLLDEPFSAIDPITRVDIYGVFEAVQRRSQVTTLLVTHDLREARRLAEHIVILNQGMIAQAGPTAQVLTNPRPGYVQSLVESQLF